MVGWKYANSSKQLNKEWHLKRLAAERTAFSIDEFSDIDIERYDLDDESVEITGRYNERTFTVEAPLIGGGETFEQYNIAELDTR